MEEEQKENERQEAKEIIVTDEGKDVGALAASTLVNIYIFIRFCLRRWSSVFFVFIIYIGLPYLHSYPSPLTSIFID